MMRKSGAAVGISTRRRHTSSEYVTPVGLENTGTFHMPLICGSAATRRSTMSMSGPSSFSGTGIISKPKCSEMEKWRS